AAPISTSFGRRARTQAPTVVTLTVRRLPLPDGAFEIARAAAKLSGADVSMDATRRGVTLAFA
ncbi:MAG: hypothetical protein U0441_38590, partial [Polyangiaceae bacterium]